jgi:hypothetical protein
LVERVEDEAVGLVSPCFAALQMHHADAFVGCEASQALEAFSEVVGGDEFVELSPQRIAAVVVEALEDVILDSAVHPLELAVGPGMMDFGEATHDALVAPAHGEDAGHVSAVGPLA